MRFLFSLFCFFLLQMHFAQSDVFETDGKGNREIEHATRIVSFPKIYDSIQTSPVTHRPLLSLKTETHATSDTIEAAVIETETLLEKYYPFYLKAAMGSSLMPLGEYYMNSTRSRNNCFGFHVKHVSFFGSLKNREKQKMAPATFDKTNVFGYFSTFQKTYDFGANVSYLNHGFHYYGLTNPNANADSLKQRFQVLNTNLQFDYHRADTNVFNLKTALDFRFLNHAKPFYDSLVDWRAKESAFSLRTMGYYRKNHELYYASIGVRHNNYAYGLMDSMVQVGDSGLLVKNTIVDFVPGIKSHLLANKLLVDIGFGLSIDVGSTTKAYFFPNIYMQFSAFNDAFIPYAKISGGVKQNSLYALYNVNPYILTNVSVKNEVAPYDITLGFKGVGGKRISYGVMANLSKINQKAFFVTDTLLSSGNRFTVIYDSLSYAKIEGNFAYQQSDKLNIATTLRYHSYTLLNEAKAWNLPQFEFLLNGSYNLYHKFIVNVELEMSFNRFAKMYAPGQDVVAENGQYYTSIGSIVDGNIGLEYRYNPRLSAFINVNNVASQRYLRFYNYPVLPIQFLAGITARF